MFLSQRKHILRVIASVGAILAMLLPAGLVGADAYGSGTYHSCNYNQTNCPSGGTTSTSSGSAAGGTSSPSSPSTSILLNDFDEYFAENGKVLDLAKSQVVYYEVEVNGTTQKYSVTVNEVGTDYAVLGISTISEPVRLAVGQTREFDLTGDGTNDISITLNSTGNNKANFTFAALSKAPNTTTAVKTTTPESTTIAKRNWVPVILSVVAVLIGLSWFVWLAIKNRKRTGQNDL